MAAIDGTSNVNQTGKSGNNQGLHDSSKKGVEDDLSLNEHGLQKLQKVGDHGGSRLVNRSDGVAGSAYGQAGN